MKILIFNSLYYPYRIGGAERSVQITAEALVEAGHIVSVCTLSDRTKRISIINGVEVIALRLRNIHWLFGSSSNRWIKLGGHLLDIVNPLYRQEVKVLLDEISPDIVWTNNLAGFSTDIWRLVSKKRIPIVHTLRDYYLTCIYSSMFKGGRDCKHSCLECSLMGRIRSAPSRRVNVVIGISQAIMERHLKWHLFKNSSRFVVPNCLEAAPNLKMRICGRDVIRFGFIGRLNHAKGVDLAIDMIQETQTIRRKRLLLAGEGAKTYEAFLHRKATELTSFLGYVEPSEFFNS